jgi:hypothetical protein
MNNAWEPYLSLLKSECLRQISRETPTLVLFYNLKCGTTAHNFIRVLCGRVGSTVGVAPRARASLSHHYIPRSCMSTAYCTYMNVSVDAQYM